ncbi:MAG: BMP family ABC transporter substrate-binding protein [Firmicutes bacterium HGW-Firmicutes-4]|jgi:basic membrane protein A|nr:MAG: BMP family ABC transporter substrate-binding protein [Firmicutes bacterium HGW-Firmicutes-4]
MKSKKKRIGAILWIGVMLISVFGCAPPQDTGAASESEPEKFELALITDLGHIDDQSFNQAAWQGLKQYAEEHGISYKYYQPEEGTTDSYVETIDQAVAAGAKLVVCPGYLFETPVFIAQDSYPDVSFILVDGQPHDSANNVSQIGKNVLSILYQDEQAGFLAGYAAVKDGHSKLGFMGGLAVPSVIRYGYGFVQGADLAAQELGITAEIQYTYTGTFVGTPAIQALATSWYDDGTEVIFSCGGAIVESVILAAEGRDNARVIGVDVDQSSHSNTVMTSAMKMLTSSVYSGIRDYYSNTFPGGTVQKFSAANNGIGLPMETSTFRSFSTQDYQDIYADLVAGEIVIASQTEDSTTADLSLMATTVSYIK